MDIMTKPPVTMEDPKMITIRDDHELRALVERWHTMDADGLVDYVVRKIMDAKKNVVAEFNPASVGWRTFLTREIIEAAPLLEAIALEQAEDRKKRKSSAFLDALMGYSNPDQPAAELPPVVQEVADQIKTDLAGDKGDNHG